DDSNQVNNRLDSVACAPHGRGLSNVPRLKFRAGAWSFPARTPGSHQLPHGMTGLAQLFGDFGAYKSGCARQQDFHRERTPRGGREAAGRKSNDLIKDEAVIGAAVG
ncbi:MAG TPA: hypothetical protein VN794_07280, partial [Methylomirabilota bacterium]|nr:hypothetical protein [Methylomirabilota bacterium]